MLFPSQLGHWVAAAKLVGEGWRGRDSYIKQHTRV